MECSGRRQCRARFAGYGGRESELQTHRSRWPGRSIRRCSGCAAGLRTADLNLGAIQPHAFGFAWANTSSIVFSRTPGRPGTVKPRAASRVLTSQTALVDRGPRHPVDLGRRPCAAGAATPPPRSPPPGRRRPGNDPSRLRPPVAGRSRDTPAAATPAARTTGRPAPRSTRRGCLYAQAARRRPRPRSCACSVTGNQQDP